MPTESWATERPVERARDNSVEPVRPVAAAGDEFDEDLYLLLNPDVAADVRTGTIRSARSHWLEHGRADERLGRRPTINDPAFYVPPPPFLTIPPSADELAEFVAADYLQSNPDVGPPGTSAEAALQHWILHGRFEGRTRRAPATRYAGRSCDFGRLMRRPFGINFYAPFSARSGLGSAARGYLRAMRAAGIPTWLCNLNYELHPARVTAADYDAVPPYRVNVIQANADTIELVYNLFRRGQFNDAYTIGIWAWELSLLRPDFYGAFAAVDEVWALSDFNTAAIAAISPVPARTMSCIVAPALPQPGLDRAHFRLPKGFLFLSAFDVGSSVERKNPGAVLEAFIDAFGDRDDVHLLLKMHSGDDADPARRELLRQAQRRANVIVRAGKLTDAENRGMQACCDCFVSAHRAEGFGLNIAECMALGKPVIATGYSGNMDFTTERNSFLVSFALRAIERTSGPYLPGYLWAEPDAADLARAMRRVVDDPEEARRRAADGAATVAQRLSPKAVGGHMRARLEELGLLGTLPAFVPLIGASRSATAPEPHAIVPRTDPADLLREPTISVIVPVYNVDPLWLQACIESVRAQTYAHWQLCLCDDASTRADTVAMLRAYQGIDPRICIVRLQANGGIAAASNAAATMATGSYLLMLDNDDELTSDAIHQVASAVIADPTIDALYADEDKISPVGQRCDHYFKPDWSPEHLESVMYTLHPLTVRTSLFLALGGFRDEYDGAQDYDLMLRVSQRTNAIHHVPKILYHWRMIEGSAAAVANAKPKALQAAHRALSDHVMTKYGPDRAEVLPAPLSGHYRVRHTIAPGLDVTLVITTNNGSISLPGRGRTVMVDNLIRSIRERTDYHNYRILVVDNGNSSARQVAAYAAAGVTLRSYSGPVSPFNYADKANFALRHVDTEHLVMMNDDMEVFEGEWLSALLEHSQNVEVGACGGNLLHADGSIQHAGVVLGVNGGSAHIYHGFPGDFVGYNGFTHVVRNYSVLTGACLATRLSVMAEVGYFDTAFAIDYNDIDLCLRMRRHGYRIVYTPFSKMYHYEGQTERRTSQNPKEVDLLYQRWGRLVDNDPFYNPNLSRTRHDFSAR